MGFNSGFKGLNSFQRNLVSSSLHFTCVCKGWDFSYAFPHCSSPSEKQML